MTPSLLSRQEGESAAGGSRVFGGGPAGAASGHQHLSSAQHGGDPHRCWQAHIQGQRSVSYVEELSATYNLILHW